jgi:hypothetical protein
MVESILTCLDKDIVLIIIASLFTIIVNHLYINCLHTLHHNTPNADNSLVGKDQFSV